MSDEAPETPMDETRLRNTDNRVKIEGSEKVGHPMHNFCTTFQKEDFRL